MSNSVLAWAAVILSAAVFAGFLFGASSALTMVERFLRQRPVALRAPRRILPSPRLWA